MVIVYICTIVSQKTIFDDQTLQICERRHRCQYLDVTLRSANYLNIAHLLIGALAGAFGLKRAFSKTESIGASSVIMLYLQEMTLYNAILQKDIGTIKRLISDYGRWLFTYEDRVSMDSTAFHE